MLRTIVLGVLLGQIGAIPLYAMPGSQSGWASIVGFLGMVAAFVARWEEI